MYLVFTELVEVSVLSGCAKEAFSQPIVRVSGFVRAEWLEQVGPGDAIVRISQEDGQQPLRACSMRRILESPSCLQAEAKESVDWDAYFARMVVRRDIPSPGMAAMLVLPLGRRHTALFQVGPVRAYALTAHPHTEPGKVIVSLGKPLRCTCLLNTNQSFKLIMQSQGLTSFSSPLPPILCLAGR